MPNISKRLLRRREGPESQRNSEALGHETAKGLSVHPTYLQALLAKLTKNSSASLSVWASLT
jgi:hypothetical protein